MHKMLMRLAKTDECDALTAFAMRTKASWGYPHDFMAASSKQPSWLESTLAQPGCDKAEIEDFLVDPNFHGRGVGTTLMSALLETCLSCGVKAVGLDADPNAEGSTVDSAARRSAARPRGPFLDGCSREWNYASTEHQARYNPAAPGNEA